MNTRMKWLKAKTRSKRPRIMLYDILWHATLGNGIRTIKLKETCKGTLCDCELDRGRI